MKILTTIGPSSDGKNLKYFVEHSDLLRLNLSHNLISWHKKILNKIKKIDSSKLVLLDIPGIKPRTLNDKPIKILKGLRYSFCFQKRINNKNFISISNPIPEIKKKPKSFFLSDGTYEFKKLEFKKNIISGVATESFILKEKKGLNIPFSIYNDKTQEKLYYKSLKKIKGMQVDCIGLSFIQNAKILRNLKKKYPNFFYISKIENFMGYEKRIEIIKNSDAIMIDRGDLAAEVGLNKLSIYIDNILEECKKNFKPCIIATENFNSLITGSLPSKSDIINLEHYISKKADYIMLSDETATSKNGKNTVRWIRNYLKSKTLKVKDQPVNFYEIIKSLKNQILIIFSKKGYFYEKLKDHNLKKIILFTQNKKLTKLVKLKSNVEGIFVKFPKRFLYSFLKENIKKNKEMIFKNNDNVYLINVMFPRKNSRANTISILNKKDFNY